jgi:hypothetical protein
MKTIFAVLLSLAAGAAHAHESLMPHHHPHGLSMLPDLDTFIVGGIFLTAVALVAYVRLDRR